MNVFVYGSLKAGFGNNYLLETSRFVGKDTFKGGTMHSLGAFPAVVPGEGVIHGEIYRVSSKTLARLDRLEGHPNFYERRFIKLESGKNAVMYFFKGRQLGEVIPNGDWQRNKRP